MAEIDRLDIVISASAEKASNALKTLAESIGDINTAVSQFSNGGKIDDMTRSLHNLSLAIGTLGKADVKGIKSIKEAMETLGSVSASSFDNIKKASEQITPIAEALGKLTTLGKEANSLDKVSNAMQRLSYVNYEKIAENMDILDDVIEDIKSSLEKLSGVGEEAKSLNKVGNAMRYLMSVANDPESIEGISSTMHYVAEGLKDFSATEEQVQQIKSVASAFNALSRAGEQSKGIDSVFESLNTKLTELSASFTVLGEEKTMMGSEALVRLTNSLTKFGAVAPQVTSALTHLPNKLSRLNTDLTKFGSGDVLKGTEAITSFATAITRLGGKDVNIGGSFELMAKSVPQLAESMTALCKGDILKNLDVLSKFVDVIAKLGSKTGSQGLTNLPQMAIRLKTFIERLNEVPKVRDDVIRAIEAVGKLQGKYNTFSDTATKGGERAHKATKKISISVAGIKAELSKATPVASAFMHLFIHKSAVKSLGHMVSKINQIAFGIRRVVIMGKNFVGAGKQMLKESMDFIETYNYFTQSMKQVAGSENKQLVADANKVFSDLTNFSADNNGFLTRDLTARGLGLDPNTTLNYQTQFAQLASSIGASSEQAMLLSEGLTKLGADLASVKNMDFETVWQNLSSGLVGMSRSVDKFGINIRANAMDQKLLQLGINTTSKELSQAEKAMLRTIIMIDSSEYAFGDLAETITTPANQLRLLEGNLKAVARGFGNIFLPVFAKVLPYLNAFAIALTKILEIFTVLLGFNGFDFGSAMGGFNDDGLGDLLDEQADSADGASKALKNYQNQILGFDEINKLQDNKSNDPTGGSIGGLSGVNGLLDEKFREALDNYTKSWQEAFEKIGNGNNTLAQKMVREINGVVTKIRKGDWEGAGEQIANLVNKGFQKLSEGTSSLPSKVEEVFNGIARLGNSFFTNLDVSVAGSFISNIANSLGNGLYEAFVTFDYTNLGVKVGELLNDSLTKIDFIKLGQGLGGWMASLPNFLVGVVNTTDFSKVGTAIMDMIRGIDFSIDFVKVFKGLATFGNGLVDAIGVIVRDAEWSNLFDDFATGITEFVYGIDFSKMFTNVGLLANRLIEFISKVVKALDFDKIGKELIDGINTLLHTINFEEIGTTISDVVEDLLDVIIYHNKNLDVQGIGQAIGDLLYGIDWFEICTKLVEAFFTSLGFAFKTFGTPGDIGMHIGQRVGDWIFGNYEPEHEEGGEYTTNVLKDDTQKRTTNANFLGQLSESYFELAKKTSLSTEEQIRFDTIKDKLTKELPGFDKIIDNTSDSYAMQESKVRGLIREQKNYYMVLAGKEAIQNYYRELFNLENEEGILNQKIETLIGTTGRYYSEQFNATITVADLADETKLYNDLLANGNITELEAVGLIEEAKRNLSDEYDEYLKLNGQLDENKQKQADVNEGIKNASELIDTYTSKRSAVERVNEALNSIGISADTRNRVKTEADLLASLLEQEGGKFKTAGESVGSAFAKAIIRSMQTDIANNPILLNIQARTNNGSVLANDRLTIHAVPYATGGFPEEGPFYMNRGEIAGKFSNGRSVVANNQQITEGIKMAVVEGMIEAFGVNGAGNNGTYVENTFMVDSEVLYKMVQQGKESYEGRVHTLASIV